jgi:proline dehydrogenase
MGLTRNVLLWASQNATLRRRLPRLPFVRRAVRQFMPGETLEAALKAARGFADRGLPTTLTHLGENVTSKEEAVEATRHYLEVLDRVAQAGLDAEISVKLTHLGLDLGRDVALANLGRLIEAAGRRDRWMWVDMEASRCLEGTLAVYREALASSSRVGLCLQAYLHRTEEDLVALLPLVPSIRLVKGAYREPEAIAIRKRPDVDRRYLALARRLLEEQAEGHLRRVAVATHDVGLIDRIDAFARGAGLSTDAYEIQMLYGIRQSDQFRFVEAGRPTRSLIGYGPAWYPWYMRRLAEKPSNLWFVLRNLFGRPPVDLGS